MSIDELISRVLARADRADTVRSDGLETYVRVQLTSRQQHLLADRAKVKARQK